MKQYIVLCGAIIANAVANIFMKAGMSKVDQKAGLLETAKSAAASVHVIAGVFCFVTALVLYLYVLSRLPLSVAYPIMTSAGFAIVVVASHFYLNEVIVMRQVVGVVVIACGIWLVAK